jgi:UTP--glucose-1-phosphate uridylyltransferase
VLEIESSDVPREIALKLSAVKNRLRDEGVLPLLQENFLRLCGMFLSGGTGRIPEREIVPVPSLLALGSFGGCRAAGAAAMDRVAVLKLNGGLGTSMGLDGPKALLLAKGGLTFLDIVCRQILAQRQRQSCRLPLILMNSFRTHEASLEFLSRYPGLAVDVPQEFCQSTVPRLDAEGIALPRTWGEAALCAPGHGELFSTLAATGMLQMLLQRGYEYLFVSNVDNLGATIDESILGYMVRERVPFLMEVVRRTAADRKGGHLARRATDGHLLLREVAQCPDEDISFFLDIERHPYFNTNNIWIQLSPLNEVLETHGGILDLPLICNPKMIQIGERETRGFQLETAIGSAINLFESAQAVEVERTRFAPVKSTADLLTLWSDAYTLSEEWRLEPNPPFPNPRPAIALDRKWFGTYEALRERIPADAPPALSSCKRLSVEGNVYFGRTVAIRGEVDVVGNPEIPGLIPSNTILENETRTASQLVAAMGREGIDLP